MKLFAKTSATMLILAALMTACGGAATPDSSALDLVLTEGVQTMVASYFSTQTAMVTPPSPTSPATATLFPTKTPFGVASASPSATGIYFTATLGILFTPSPTGTLATPTTDAASLAYGCNNLAFVRDVTIPSGTTLKPGDDFMKTWKVANTGTCNWMYQYALVLVSGNAMNGKTTKLGKVITAGHWAELSVGMGAPNSPGTYTSYWRLMDADGHLFGATLGVSFTVGSPTDTPAPTSLPTSTPVPTETPVPTDTLP